MFEPTEREFDDEVKRSIEQFERARIGEAPPLEPRLPQKLLLVLDGSTQDETGAAVALGLQQRLQCELLVMDAREHQAENHLATETAERLGAQAVEKLSGDSYEQILSAVQRTGCDVVVVPSPFERELDKVGSDSTGTVIDVLLSRCPIPLLVIRRRFAVEQRPFSRVQLVLIGENDVAREAGAWAVGLVTESGLLQLALQMPREVLEEVRDLLRSLAPEQDVEQEQIEEAMQRSSVRLHRALQQAADDKGFRYQLVVHRDDAFNFDTFDESHSGWLLVLALERKDPASEGRVNDRIRHSPVPVLVVPAVAGA